MKNDSLRQHEPAHQLIYFHTILPPPPHPPSNHADYAEPAAVEQDADADLDAEQERRESRTRRSGGCSRCTQNHRCRAPVHLYHPRVQRETELGFSRQM
jgi:hypothetical protein